MLASWTYQCFLIEMEGSRRQHHRDREACCGLAAQFPKDQTTTAHTLLVVETTPTSTRTSTTPPPANGRNNKLHGVREIPISHGNQPASQPTGAMTTEAPSTLPTLLNGKHLFSLASQCRYGYDNIGSQIRTRLVWFADRPLIDAIPEPCHQTGCRAPLGHRIDGSPAPHLLRHSQKSHSARFPRWTLIQWIARGDHNPPISQR